MSKTENPNALKHLINKRVLTTMATAIQNVFPEFDGEAFISFHKQLDGLELKARVQLVRDLLKKFLPDDYKKALKILIDSLKNSGLSGFALWPYTEYIQTFGLEDPLTSLNALAELTKLFTAEFAVRPFIQKHPKQTLAYLEKCSLDENVHLRRWASEGSRSRLPWGLRLQEFIKDHKPTLKILETLKFDSELYVRKSVSNHLNDMAKDHPDVVIKILSRWKKQSPPEHVDKINWIIHRALRSLIKAGHPEALQLINVSAPEIHFIKFKLNNTTYKIGDRLDFEFEIESDSKNDQQMVIDYIIHFAKFNKTNKAKVFKLKNLNLKSGQKLKISKSHHLKKVSTRVYHKGLHFIEIQINGKPMGQKKWTLI